MIGGVIRRPEDIERQGDGVIDVAHIARAQA
jgi:hypothetical protein